MIHLTYIAEDLGKAPSEYAVPWLLELLHHTKVIVREGALYGLENHLEVPGVLEAVIKISSGDPLQSDPSKSIREIAREMVGDHLFDELIDSRE